MLFGIIGYMVIAIFSFPRERIEHNLLLMLIIAFTSSIYHQVFPTLKGTSRAAVLIFNIVTVLLLVFCVIIGCIRLGSEIHVKKALAARKIGDWKETISEIDQADSLFYPLDPFSIPPVWYRANGNYAMGKYQEAHDDYKKAYQANPNNIHVLNNLGTSYAKLGHFETAAKFYKKAVDIQPGFEEARINLALVYFQLGDDLNSCRHLMLLDHNGKDQPIVAYTAFIDNTMKQCR
jgi:tetratricopeptide (TPR) repeat protein